MCLERVTNFAKTYKKDRVVYKVFRTDLGMLTSLYKHTSMEPPFFQSFTVFGPGLNADENRDGIHFRLAKVHEPGFFAFLHRKHALRYGKEMDYRPIIIKITIPAGTKVVEGLNQAVGGLWRSIQESCFPCVVSPVIYISPRSYHNVMGRRKDK